MKTIIGRFARVTRVGVVLAVVLLMAAPGAIAQEKAMGDGIKVHGHWTIDVKNPDGSVASHHEFENALLTSGQVGLSSILTRNMTIAGWEVELLGAAAASLSILEPSFAQTFPGAQSYNLAVNTSPNGQQIILEGTVHGYPAVSISLTDVDTVIVFEGPGGQVGGTVLFSGRALPQAIAVQAGQLVQVTVVFSFS